LKQSFDYSARSAVPAIAHSGLACRGPDITDPIYSDAHPSSSSTISDRAATSTTPAGRCYIDYFWLDDYFDCTRHMDFLGWRNYFDRSAAWAIFGGATISTAPTTWTIFGRAITSTTPATSTISGRMITSNCARHIKN
jgi:hypothetical protein